MSSVDVLIAGAGPTGLLLATLLKRQGISCRLVEKNPNIAKESRAIGIQAKTLELMKNIGLVEEFLAKGMKAAGASVYLNGKKRLSLDIAEMALTDTPYPFIYFVPQDITEDILAKDLKNQGVDVERGCALVDFSQNSDGIIASVQKTDGSMESIRAKYLVGCDGSHSVVRKKLGLVFKGDAYSSDFIMADAKMQWDLPHDKLQVFLEDGQLGVFFPLKGNLFSRVLTVQPTDDVHTTTTETTSSPARLEDIEVGFNKASHMNIKLVDATWVTKFRVHHRCVERFSVERIFLAGDAAHIHSPIGAQGMNTGLQDAANLAWKLAQSLKNGESKELLETYHSERWPIAQHLLNFTDRAFSVATSKNPALLFARGAFFPLFTKIMMSFPLGKRLLFRFVSQTGIKYQKSIAALEDLVKKGPLAAGKRAPNAKLKSGQEIFDLLTGYRFHLLVFGDILRKDQWLQSTLLKKTAPLIHKISIDEKEIYKLYGVMNEAVFLIRPDGHIGYVCDDLNAAFLGTGR